MTTSSIQQMLRTLSPDELPILDRRSVDPEALALAAEILEDTRARGELAIREAGARFGDLSDKKTPLLVSRAELDAALEELPKEQSELLQRTADRIRKFATAQRASLSNLETGIIGGRAGHELSPVQVAGCYAPGGRYPLPSSVLMTAVTAKAAGVPCVWVASPTPGTLTKAAAAVAGADGMLALGGAQAVVAMALGAVEGMPAADVIAGPGNRWVTAAKMVVSSDVGIDMLAGPSELTVLADQAANPELVAADLLAQAEHDDTAVTILVTTSAKMIEQVREAAMRLLADLPDNEIATASLNAGFSVLCADLDQACNVCNRLAPEHLALHLAQAKWARKRLSNYGCLFLGERSAMVFGDYGAGPNHVLPTGGTARFSGGLSVFHFMSIRNWMEMDDPEGIRAMAQDAAELARMEGLEAHARAADRRR